MTAMFVNKESMQIGLSFEPGLLGMSIHQRPTKVLQRITPGYVNYWFCRGSIFYKIFEG